MKIKEMDCAITSNSIIGPTFGYMKASDVFIPNYCNIKIRCYINNDGKRAYECYPQYKSSLFVNTAGPDSTNYFTVLDYEVFCIDFEGKSTINHMCKNHDIISENIETKDISEESLKQLNNEKELLDDMDAIHCDNNNNREKISNYYLNSSLFPNSAIMIKDYDKYLREWIGNGYQWKLIYRSSDYGYTASSFHENCDSIQGPTLIIIKSDGGWIFGGYTTQSWSGDSIFVSEFFIHR